ncbi:MAG: phosphoglucosamine mutase [Clostridia bacterium]|nr:phosphoglucosamine mutase [Clostridia bacterium]
MNDALPQIEKVIKLCSFFRISTDTLLSEGCALPFPQKEEGEKAPRPLKYFGTDGFRGEANVALTSFDAYRVGRFLGWYFTSPLAPFPHGSRRTKIVIGKDTRRSSYMLEYALVAGMTASGADVYMLHVTTTPSVSYVTRQEGFDCGIMISASHNPYYDNGIKIINRFGEKMDDGETSLIEAYLDNDLKRLGLTADIPLAKRESIGAITDYIGGRNRYVGYLISIASHSYRSLRIGLDCANGASWMIAKAVFDALGAETVLLGAEPNGLNINQGCGSTHIEALKQLVKERRLDVGFAFDGDADRCIAVDEKGNEVNGDHILYILGKRLKAKGILDGNTVVATVMSNTGLHQALEEAEILCELTAVGDRFVYECMQEKGYRIGGEQSGHIILKKYATTGDGILTAIMLTEEMLDAKLPLSRLYEGMVLFPQCLKNVPVSDKDAILSHPALCALKGEIEAEIGKFGRVLLRKSGTEPVLRVMVECREKERCEAYAKRLAKCIEEADKGTK